jgi:tRNA G37 N-methylase TrmD
MNPSLPLANLGGLPKVVEKEDTMSSFSYKNQYLDYPNYSIL